MKTRSILYLRRGVLDSHEQQKATVGKQAARNIQLRTGNTAYSATKKLIEARKTPDFVIAVISKNVLVELVSRQVLKQLSEDRFPRIHPGTSSVGTEADYKTNRDNLSSNRKVAFQLICFCNTMSYRALKNR